MDTEAQTARRKQGTVIVQGRVLYNSGRAVRIETPISKEWIPLSQIISVTKVQSPKSEVQSRTLNLELGTSDLEEGAEATLIIPLWLAREKGLAE